MTPLVDYTVSGLPASHMATILRAVELILLGVVCSLAIPPTGQGECHTPDQVIHTEQFGSQSYKIGDRLRYKCQSGFKRKAGTSNLIKCVTSNGHAKWSASNLKCITVNTSESSTVLNFTEEPSTAVTDQKETQTYSNLTSYTTDRVSALATKTDMTSQYVTMWTRPESATSVPFMPTSERAEATPSTSPSANKTTTVPTKETSNTMTDKPSGTQATYSDQNKTETYKAKTYSDLSSHTTDRVSTMRTGGTTPQYVTTWTSTESEKKITIVPKSEQTETALSTSAPANKTTPVPNEESSTTANTTGTAQYSLAEQNKTETSKATTYSDLSSHTTDRVSTMRTGGTTPQYVTTWTSTESEKKITIVPKSEQTETALSTSAPANKTTPVPNEESSTTANTTGTAQYSLAACSAGVFILLVIIPIVLLHCKRVCHCRKYKISRDRRLRNLDNHEDMQESLALTQLLPQEHVETQQVSTTVLPNEEEEERTRL
ncbi:interleukin-15 receptor subunit alpha isoform X2 [Protopterus annectens]|uniref:interleukin-15 receptor subunit alpha isoform X2 n=1 Tax=Protopterus annectens TaxID=7888 RepID=UPI001CFB3AF9|nr:interleukin-15 receptor subunit alpha isoform X2 [Protopterus annectens]